EGGWGSGIDVSLLVNSAEEQPECDWQDGAARYLYGCAQRDSGGRAGAMRAVSGRYRNYWERRDELASSFGDDADQPNPSHDGIIREAGTGDGSENSARGIECGLREHEEAASGSL